MQKFSISNDPEMYEAWPDVAMTSDDGMVTVFSECTHHRDRSYTRIMYTHSYDRGRSWSRKLPLTEGTLGLPYYYNCARISRLADGRLAVIVDRIRRDGREDTPGGSEVLICFSADEGHSWSEPAVTPLDGIVPERLTELDNGRWLISAHHRENGLLAQFLHFSDDQGRNWSPAVKLASSPVLNLCEVSLIPLGKGTVAALLRENSGRGLDCMKTISRDNGETWEPLCEFPLPGCHRPTGGLLADGKVLVTYRFLQGGRGGWLSNRCQNFFAALSDVESLLAPSREGAAVRILPVDFDRSPFADLGYSGWVEFPDGEIYIVSYIVDDAWDRAQIRGYSLTRSDFLLTR